MKKQKKTRIKNRRVEIRIWRTKNDIHTRESQYLYKEVINFNLNYIRIPSQYYWLSLV